MHYISDVQVSHSGEKFHAKVFILGGFSLLLWPFTRWPMKIVPMSENWHSTFTINFNITYLDQQMFQ